MWLGIAVRTIKRVVSRKMFFAPCLGTDLFGRKALANQNICRTMRMLDRYRDVSRMSIYSSSKFTIS